MFHTVELYRNINSLEYYHLFNSLKSLSKNSKTKYYENHNDKREIIFNCFTKNGITIIMKEYEFDIYTYHKIKIRINPKRLIKNNEFIEVAKESDLESIRKEFRKVMSTLRKEVNKKSRNKLIFAFDDLNRFYVRRIDFCVNIFFKNSEKVMELIRRSDIPNKFSPYLIYDTKDKRWIMPKKSFYINSELLTINIYLKSAQMHNDNYFSSIDISTSEGIIRFEVQCYLQKVNNIKSKYKIDINNIFNIATKKIAEETLRYYLKKTVGFEDYYTLSEAKNLINNSRQYRDSTKKEMIDLIALINKKRSIPKARKEYSGKALNFNMLIKKIRALNINPVTIPVNWNINHLLNPIHEINKKFI